MLTSTRAARVARYRSGEREHPPIGGRIHLARCALASIASASYQNAARSQLAEQPRRMVGSNRCKRMATGCALYADAVEREPLCVGSRRMRPGCRQRCLVRWSLGRLRRASRVTPGGSVPAGVPASGKLWPSLARSSIIAAALAAGVLPILNALGGSTRSENAVITVRQTHRPGRGGSSRNGNSLTVQLQSGPVELQVSAETQQRLWSAQCAHIELRSGLLGVEWCLRDCVTVAKKQTLLCDR
jgi:hypothetical protein